MKFVAEFVRSQQRSPFIKKAVEARFSSPNSRYGNDWILPILAAFIAIEV